MEVKNSTEKKELDEFKTDFSLDGLRNFQPNIILCKMTNASQSIQSSKNNKRVVVSFGEFYTAEFGYLLSISVDLYRDKIEMNVALREGDYDDILDWPFPYRIEMTLLNQVDDTRNRSVIFTPATGDFVDAQLWKRPREKQNDKVKPQFTAASLFPFASTEAPATATGGLFFGQPSFVTSSSLSTSTSTTFSFGQLPASSSQPRINAPATHNDSTETSPKQCDDQPIIDKFIPISCINLIRNYHHQQFLRNDTLYFQFKFLSPNHPASSSCHNDITSSTSSNSDSSSIKVNNDDKLYIPKSLSTFNDNFHIMKISGINDRLKIVDDELQVNWKVTESFLTNPCGYQLQVSFLISIDYICVAFKILSPSELFKHSDLKWPFNKQIQITLMNQVEDSNNQDRYLSFDCQPVAESGNWLRCLDTNHRLIQIISIDELRNGGFIRNDCVLVKIKTLNRV